MNQEQFVEEYFLERPKQVICSNISKPELENLWLQKTGTRFEDSDRTIRRLFDKGFLVKIKKGCYMYDPDATENKSLKDFDAKTKKNALERDGYKCVMCGMGKDNGIDLQVDHIKARSNGGDNSLENAQTLCGSCNFRKKDLSQLAFGKKLFLKLREETSKFDNSESKKLNSFAEEVLGVYAKYEIDITIDDNYGKG